MYSVSQDYKDAMASAVQQGYINGEVGGVQFDADDVLLGSCSISNSCADSTEVKLGGVYVGQLNITFCNKNIIPRNSWEGKKIKIYWNQRVDMRDEYERYEQIPCGVYTIAEANHSAEGVVVTAYDDMSKLDKRVSFSALTPGHASAFMRIIANRCSITLAQTAEEIDDLGAGGENLQLYQDSDINTYRDLLSWLAQTCGCFATFNRDGELELRPFGEDSVFTFTEYDRFAGCYFSDFETFFGGLSFVDLNTNTVITRVEHQNGLVMALGSNPFLQNKLAPYANFLLACIYNELENFHATPFKTSTLGNPVFDLGDIIEFTGRSAGTSSRGCLMSYVCTFGHEYDMEGYGKNPTTQGAQSKTDKNISGLTRQSAANENVFLFLTNATEFEAQDIGDFQDGEFFLGQLQIGATKDTNIEAQTRVTYKVAFLPEDDPPEFGAFRVWLRYELDHVVIKRVPFWRPLGLISSLYSEYEDTVVDYQPLLNLAGGDLKTLDVYFEYQYTGATSTGDITIDAEGFELTVKGQGIAAIERWDGLITVADTVPLYNISALSVLPLGDDISVTKFPFLPVTLSEEIAPPELMGFYLPVNRDIVAIKVSPPTSNLITESGVYNITDETGVYNIVTE